MVNINKKCDNHFSLSSIRSPEIILGLPSTKAIDVWSLGCVAESVHWFLAVPWVQ